MEGDYSQLEFRVAGFLGKDAQAYIDVKEGIRCSQLYCQYYRMHATRSEGTYLQAFIRRHVGHTSPEAILQRLQGKIRRHRKMARGASTDGGREKGLSPYPLVASTPSLMLVGRNTVQLHTARRYVTILCRDSPPQTYCLPHWFPCIEV